MFTSHSYLSLFFSVVKYRKKTRWMLELYRGQLKRSIDTVNLLWFGRKSLKLRCSVLMNSTSWLNWNKFNPAETSILRRVKGGNARYCKRLKSTYRVRDVYLKWHYVSIDIFRAARSPPDVFVRFRHIRDVEPRIIHVPDEVADDSHGNGKN